MTDAHKQQLVDALIAPDDAWLQGAGKRARQELEEINILTVKLLEPFIDKLMVAAFKAGQACKDHKTEEQIVNAAVSASATPEMPS